MPIPAYYLPLLSPRGHRLHALPGIAVGSYVQRGQRLASNHWGELLHAPATGTLTALQTRPVALPHAPGVATWMLTPDPQAGAPPMPPAPLPAQRQHLERLGLTGLGGAAFPAHRKWPASVNLLVINAMECEPDITADAALLAMAPQAVAQGILWLREALGQPRTVLALKPGLPCPPVPPVIERQTLAGGYPSGAERLLLARVSHYPLTATQPPAAVGIVCHNIGTAYAVWQSLTTHLPPLGRWISLSGPGLLQPQTRWAIEGTRLRDLLEQCGYQGTGGVRVGGRYSGYPLPAEALEAPLQSHINALHVAPARVPPIARACIRCGLCTQACPLHLPAQELYRALAAQHAPDISLQHCLVCGLCETVCPSQIPLNTWLRQGKWAQRQQQAQALQAAQATAHHAARTQRLAHSTAQAAAQRAQRLAEHLETYRDDPLRLAKLQSALQQPPAQTHQASSP